MDSVEDYVRQWAKHEKEDLYSLSEWVKNVRSLMQIRIKKRSGFMSNFVCVCKSHYIDCLIKQIGIDNSFGNTTFTPTTLTKEDIMDNHRSVLCSFWNFNQRWRTGCTITLLDSKIAQVSFQTALYWWICQMLHETSFQMINLYSIGGQKRASELMWH